MAADATLSTSILRWNEIDLDSLRPQTFGVQNAHSEHPDAKTQKGETEMALRNLIPWNRTNRQHSPVAPQETQVTVADDFRNLRRIFETLLESTLSGTRTSFAPVWPHLELKDADDHVTISAELPGMTEKDLDVTIGDGLLTIRGEKQSANDDRESGWSERYYGRFERTISLPDGADSEHCEAIFSNGVLTVTMPKTDAKRSTRRIPLSGKSQSRAA